MAKREKIRAAYSEARVQMEQLRQWIGGEAEAEKVKLYQAAFGQTFDSYVRPDDKDRAIQLTRGALELVEPLTDPEGALRLAQRAALTSDTYLLRAVAQRAFEWG